MRYSLINLEIGEEGRVVCTPVPGTPVPRYLPL
jgi:hypothetical protein